MQSSDDFQDGHEEDRVPVQPSDVFNELLYVPSLTPRRYNTLDLPPLDVSPGSGLGVWCEEGYPGPTHQAPYYDVSRNNRSPNMLLTGQPQTLPFTLPPSHWASGHYQSRIISSSGSTTPFNGLGYDFMNPTVLCSAASAVNVSPTSYTVTTDIDKHSRAGAYSHIDIWRYDSTSNPNPNRTSNYTEEVVPLGLKADSPVSFEFSAVQVPVSISTTPCSVPSIDADPGCAAFVEILQVPYASRERARSRVLPRVSYDGFPLANALAGNFADMPDGSTRAFPTLSLGQKVSFRFQFSDTSLAYNRQVNVLRQRRPSHVTVPEQPTKADFAVYTARELRRYLDARMRYRGEAATYALNDLVLISIDFVSKASVQPRIGILRQAVTIAC